MQRWIWNGLGAMLILVLLNGCQSLNSPSYYAEYVPVDDVGDWDRNDGAVLERESVAVAVPASDLRAMPPMAMPVAVPVSRELVSRAEATPVAPPVNTGAVDTQAGSEFVEKIVPAATVTHVNIADGYVILKCVKLPKANEDAELLRMGQPVAKVKLVSSRRGQYLVADIVDGVPQRGDIARYKVLFPRKATAEKEKQQKDSQPKKKNSRGLPLFF